MADPVSFDASLRVTTEGYDTTYEMSSGTTQDLIIRCGRHAHHVHRMIVSTQSQFFNAICNGSFQEASTGVITLAEDDPATVSRMLTHFYGYEYDDTEPSLSKTHHKDNAQAEEHDDTPKLTASELKMLNDVLVYAIAEKYDLTLLMILATYKFEDIHDQVVSTDEARACLAGFLPILVAIYETTPPCAVGLRQSAARFCSKHMSEIVADDTWWEFLTQHRDFMIYMSDARR